jgi:hypothetical protein
VSIPELREHGGDSFLYILDVLVVPRMHRDFINRVQLQLHRVADVDRDVHRNIITTIRGCSATMANRI